MSNQEQAILYQAALCDHEPTLTLAPATVPSEETAPGRRTVRRRSPAKRIAELLLPVIDFVIVPFVYPVALFLKLIRMAGVQRMPRCREAFFRVGLFPVRTHYFEPLVDPRSLKRPLGAPRHLPGIAWNIEGQLGLLDSFSFNDELRDIPDRKTAELSFHFNNGSFESGDAEFLYNLIRLRKPARILEIGSGNSTLMAIRAVRKNEEELPGYRCRHICIEPFEKPWLEETGVTVLRQRVEDVDRSIFAELEADDILFIDSSHVIRPQGDVLLEYLELLPSLNVGVIVHIHDIFSPRDYPVEWVRDEVRLWNEQYLLEAFLTDNPKWMVIGSLNHLHHGHRHRLQAKSPYLTDDDEPGSFYIEKIA